MYQYAIVIVINGDKYYLASYDKTLTKSIRDSMIFFNEKVALFYATMIENEIEGCLCKTEKVSISNLL